MQQIALEGLSDEEREKVLKQLQLLRLGKLGPEEREELLKRLRITATYYEKNKDQLQGELEKWLAQKVKVKKIKKKK